MTNGPVLAPLAAAWLEDVDLENNYGICDAYQKVIEKARNAANKNTYHITRAGIPLPSSLTDQLHNGNGMMILEGRIATSNASVTILIKNKETGVTVAESKLPLMISKVEDMYRTVNLMYATTEYDGTPRNRESQGTFTRITEPPGYPDSETNEKYFVFVHGFNVSPKKTRGWNAEVFKRLHQLGSCARFVGITWDSDELFPNYHRAVFQAFQTGDVLGGALSFTSGADVTIAAHSLGNMVVSHAIQDGGFLPTRYYAINAAVPREAYTTEGITNAEKRRMVERLWKIYWDYNPDNAAEPPLKHLFAANWHQLFPSEDERSKLTWKNRFSSIRSRMYNFYSPGDDVVRDADPNRDSASVLETAFSGDGLAAYSWAAQEYVKGGTSAARLAMAPPELTIQGGWSLHPNRRIAVSGGYRQPNISELLVYSRPSLIGTPLFWPFIGGNLHDAATGSTSIGSNKAAEPKVKYNLLARGIPALSFAAATHIIDGAKGNFDMQGTLRTDSNEWPKEGRTDDFRKDQWLHSDMKDVSFLHVYKLYQQFITTGELNQ